MRASDLDDTLSSPARIAIMAALVPGQALSFTVLKRATGLADGNLHVQARKLAAAECLIIRKQPHQGKRCDGRTSMVTWEASMPLAEEKQIGT